MTLVWVLDWKFLSELAVNCRNFESTTLVWRRISAAPASVAPRQKPVRIGGQGLGHDIQAGGAERLAAQQSRQSHPATGPKPVTLDRLVSIVRAGRQMPAVESDQRRERIAVRLDQTAAGKSGRSARSVKQSVKRQRGGGQRRYSAAALAARLVSIWPMASTTASKVSNVDACRAL